MPQDTIGLNETKPDKVIELPPEEKATADTVYVPAPKSEFQRKSDYYSGLALPLTLLLLAVIWIIVKMRFGKSKGWVEIGSRNEDENDDGDGSQPAEPPEPCLCYEGRNLDFSNVELISILNKRSAYYTKLNPFEKEKFIRRLKDFISKKTFMIHDNSGFKEMPVLVSASAIQLSFGLENYLLHNFPVINIYPQEFLLVHPNIRFLEGNVSDNCINISWKHFLNGFQIPDDGQNVGLHEMAHAYYYQNLQCSSCEDEQFRQVYPSFEQTGNKVFEQEKIPGNDFYSDYALRNFQEFWAESIEIFFEKPVQLKASYPELYDAIHSLLKQDMARHES